MKDCKWFEKSFSDYIDGQLDSKIVFELEEHLKNCPMCMQIIQRMKIIGKSLQSLPQLNTSKDFETVLRTRIRVEMGLKRNSWLPNFDGFSLKVPAYVVSFALLAAMVFFISQQSSQQDSTGAVSPISISKNDSKLSNSKLVNHTLYELPEYNIDREYYRGDSTRLKKNYFVKDYSDSVQNVNETQQSPVNQYHNQIQPVSYSF